MKFRSTIITPYSYSYKANAIKKKLARFKWEDFLTNLFIHLESFRDSRVGVVSNFPWCCFLALKWKFSSKENADAMNMTYDDFIKVINMVYDLQNEASNLSSENNVILGVRRILINQLLYQQSDKFNYASLIRQYIWYCKGTSFYTDEFKRITGVDLDSYYKMASYFVLISSINSKSDSEIFPIKLFILYWVPIVGVEQVRNFIKLVSIKPYELFEYIGGYAYSKSVTIEYYQDTPMLQKPVLLTDSGLTVLSKKILKAGLVNLVPEILKDNSLSYKDKFGKTLERYTASVMNYYGYSYLSESEIKKIYKQNGIEGKSADFLITENNSRVLVDCKAIEPAPFVKTTSDPQRLKERLSSSFIKGIFQCQETAKNLLTCGSINPQESLSIIIVIHRDHYISSGDDVLKLIYPDLEMEIVHLYGEVPVPISNIYYITIDAFERLLGICKMKGISLNEFIMMCAEKDKNPSTKMASINFHMANFMPEGVKDTKEISEVANLLFDDIGDVIESNNTIWDNKVETYVEIYNYIVS